MSQAISSLFLILSFGIYANAEPLQDALNGMQVMMNGQPTFNPEFYNELVTCMNSLDSRLLTSVGSQWDGMIQYANAGGNPEANDTWPACTARGKWFEFNCTTQEYGNMPIFFLVIMLQILLITTPSRRSVVDKIGTFRMSK